MARRSWVSTLTLVLACTTGGSSDGSQTDAAESVETGDGEGETCANDDLHLSDCGATGSPTCQGFDIDRAGTIDAVEGECIWTALRDRSPGSFVRITQGEDDSSTTITLLVADGDGLLRQATDYVNGVPCSDPDPVEACTLREVAFFDACLTDATDECLGFANWYTGCALTESC